MSDEKLSDFEQFMIDLINNGGKFQFVPHIFYNYDGDQLEIYWENVSYYGDSEHWRRGFVLMRAMDDKRIVGVIIFNPRKYLGTNS